MSLRSRRRAVALSGEAVDESQEASVAAEDQERGDDRAAPSIPEADGIVGLEAVSAETGSGTGETGEPADFGAEAAAGVEVGEGIEVAPSNEDGDFEILEQIERNNRMMADEITKPAKGKGRKKD